MLTVFSDMTQSEIQVSAAFVQECAEVSQGLETLGAYSLHDLVTSLEFGILENPGW